MFTQLLAAALLAVIIVSAPADTYQVAAPAPWHLVRQGDPGQSLSSISCPGPRTCYVAGSAILQTRDGGSRWDTALNQIPGGSSTISCPDTTTCFVSTAAGYLLTTHDGGATWSRRRLSVRPLGPIACPTQRVCYTVLFSRATDQRDVVLATDDGGARWIRHRLPISRDLPAIACPATETCQLAGGGYTARTADGGRHWVIRNNGMDTGIGTNGSELTGVACPTAAVCYLVSAAYGREWTGGSVYRSHDSGAHWAALYSDIGSTGAEERLRAIACVNTRTCYAVGEGRYILFTRDGGSHWSKQPSGAGTTLDAATCTRRGRCFAAGDAGVVISNAPFGHSGLNQARTVPVEGFDLRRVG